MKKSCLFALMLLTTGALGTGCSREPASSDKGSLTFSSDWSASLDRAEAQNKPILLFFGGDW